MAACAAAENGAEVVLLERNEKVGRKIMITGKGRCNVTNNCRELNELIAAVPVNGRFLYSAFSRFMPSDTIEFFENMRVPLKTERGNRVFPESDSAADIVDALFFRAKHFGVEIVCGRAEKLITDSGRVSGVCTFEGDKLYADSVVIATGGLSYPRTGSTGDGYELARQAGHTIVEPKPSLVPLEVHEGFCTRLQGLSLKNVAITVEDTEKRKKVYSDFGEMLFTHFGISGPLILSASSFYSKKVYGKQVTLLIDLKPALTVEQLDKRIVRDFDNAMNKSLKNALSGLLPSGIIDTIIVQSLLDAHKPVHDITKEERSRLVYTLKGLNMTVTGTRPYTEAIITQGGINVKEINPSTMESKLIPGMYIAGELMDVDALTGGFNLQVAWSSGYLAGMSAATKQGE